MIEWGKKSEEERGFDQISISNWPGKGEKRERERERERRPREGLRNFRT